MRDIKRSAAQGTAIVIGGSITGLLAARTLSSTFDRVLVLERDNLPLVHSGSGEGRRRSAVRKGTPQVSRA